MKKVKILMILIPFCIITNFTVAQNNKMYDTFRKLITINDQVFYSNNFYEKCFTFTISMGVNSKGMIDTIIYSDKDNKDLDRLINFNHITEGLKRDRTDFLNHKSEFLILFVVIIRGDDGMITLKNGDELIKNWQLITQNVKELQEKRIKQTLLVPLLITSRGKAIKN